MTLPRFQRVASYALIISEGRILLCRLAPRIAKHEAWTLPGGGIEHGEHPRDAVVREVMEETGLDVQISDSSRVYSAHLNGVPRDGKVVDGHAIRIVYDGWVAKDSPEPHVVETDGSTVDARWHAVEDVYAGRVPVVPMVKEALADYQPFQFQRLAAYALIERGEGAERELLLTRISPRGHYVGAWTLPGGGVDHGEPPSVSLGREVYEECGVLAAVGDLLDVHDTHFSGTAPDGRYQDFHGVHLIFGATVPSDAEPRVVETDGTTDAVGWVRVAAIEAGEVRVLEVVRHALGLSPLDSTP